MFDLNERSSRSSSRLFLDHGENFDFHISAPIAASVAVFWFLRATALVLLFIIRDEEADFATLETTGAAFGLVVDAYDLHKAVSHVLKHGRPWPGKIRTYKASLQRMRETMAISYRWQQSITEISEGGHIIEHVCLAAADPCGRIGSVDSMQV